MYGPPPGMAPPQIPDRGCISDDGPPEDIKPDNLVTSGKVCRVLKQLFSYCFILKLLPN